ncbi:hypothetical protein SOM16_22875 [Pedobacter sp. CFBP9032]|nr:hypothetical protein [Pedobacter sp. CFBP9032]
MMEGENVKASAKTFTQPLPKAARTPAIFHRGLCCRPQSLNDFIQHQVQALSFASFCQEKEESPSAASRGKPSAAEKQPVQKPPRPTGTPPMEWNCNRSLSIAILLA